MKVLLICVVCLFLILSCSDIETKWEAVFTPAGPGAYRINGLWSLKASTYATGSYCTEQGHSCITAMYNEKGELLWYNVYKPRQDVATEGVAVVLSTVSTFDTLPAVYVLCRTGAMNGRYCAVLVKYDTHGNIQWEKEIHKAEYNMDCKLMLDSRGNVCGVGWYAQPADPDKIFLCKYSPSGECMWSTVYANPRLSFHDMKAGTTRDNNIIVAGSCQNTEGFFYMRFGTLGDLKFLKILDISGQNNQLSDMACTDDGCVYMTGTSFNVSSDNDYITAAFDSKDSLLWMQYFDESGNNDRAKALSVDRASNTYITGVSTHGTSSSRIVTLKYDRNGNELWTSSYQGMKEESAEPMFMTPGLLWTRTKDQILNFYIVGSIGNDVLFLRHNTNGFFTWSDRYSRGKETTDIPCAVSFECMAVESISDRGPVMSIVKYGIAKHIGFARLD
jgi:hypothetical protein